MTCAACRVNRDPADLLVFWPNGQPEVRRFVCRPTRPNFNADGSCFARAVATVSTHTIALAVAPLAVAREPIRPRTEQWAGLMREAGVRVAA